MKSLQRHTAYLLSLAMFAAGCAHTPPLTMRVPAEGVTLRLLPGADTPEALAAARALLRSLALVDEQGRPTLIQVEGQGVELPVRPGMRIHVVENGRIGGAVLAFERGDTLPIPGPETMERGVATEAGTFFIERSAPSLALRSTGDVSGDLIQAVAVAEAGEFTVYFAPGASAGSYDKMSTHGSLQFLGVLQSANVSQEYIWSGFLVLMVVAAVVIAFLVADGG